MTILEKFQSFFQQRLRELHPEDELVWISSEVPVEALRAGYPLGIFPWPGEDEDLFPWLAPSVRGILPFERFRLGKSTRRQLNRASFEITFDQAFPEVIQTCAHYHGHETWIHPKMVNAYTAAHRLGFARSVEVWQDGELAGGLYGIDSGFMFSGESMFHRRPNAGKAAIRALVDHLETRGHRFLDIQQLTPHMEAMGAIEIDRCDFELMRKDAVKATVEPRTSNFEC
ncbi:MAG: leucyl/phenylalanyl-tRNA--protein transferase [Verrucomicrobia bacterium]|nr:leucyl/phenylalanyl-tRNA--protein transferase [Verrucomicrobiota bacterium]MCH8512530.1 leucyl/phenylalanyl-tRNA--protein transferase [Kiritimatiellia bacterium]